MVSRLFFLAFLLLFLALSKFSCAGLMGTLQDPEVGAFHKEVLGDYLGFLNEVPLNCLRR